MRAVPNAGTTASGVGAWFIGTREWLGRFPLSILQLGLRIGVGAVFFNADALRAISAS